MRLINNDNMDTAAEQGSLSDPIASTDEGPVAVAAANPVIEPGHTANTPAA